MRLAPLLGLLALAGCRVEAPAGAGPSDTLAVAVSPGDTLAETTGEPRAPEPSCTLVAEDSVALYARPSVASARFGALAPGDSVPATGRAPGFVGVAPGTAQAANVGPFRLRYAAADGLFALRGDCADLEPQPRLSPTACYEMAARPVRLHARPDTASDVVATIPGGSYAEATRRTASGWLYVRLAVNGPPGWVAPDDVNVNGPSCEAL
jgi:hypothetical protein